MHWVLGNPMRSRADAAAFAATADALAEALGALRGLRDWRTQRVWSGRAADQAHDEFSGLLARLERLEHASRAMSAQLTEAARDMEHAVRHATTLLAGHAVTATVANGSTLTTVATVPPTASAAVDVVAVGLDTAVTTRLNLVFRAADPSTAPGRSGTGQGGAVLATVTTSGGPVTSAVAVTAPIGGQPGPFAATVSSVVHAAPHAGHVSVTTAGNSGGAGGPSGPPSAAVTGTSGPGVGPRSVTGTTGTAAVGPTPAAPTAPAPGAAAGAAPFVVAPLAVGPVAAAGGGAPTGGARGEPGRSSRGAADHPPVPAHRVLGRELPSGPTSLPPNGSTPGGTAAAAPAPAGRPAPARPSVPPSVPPAAAPAAPFGAMRLRTDAVGLFGINATAGLAAAALGGNALLPGAATRPDETDDDRDDETDDTPGGSDE